MRCSEESLVPNQMDSAQPFHEWPLREDGKAFLRWAQQYGSEAWVLRVSLTRGCLWPLWNPSPPLPFLAELFFPSLVGLTSSWLHALSQSVYPTCGTSNAFRKPKGSQGSSQNARAWILFSPLCLDSRREYGCCCITNPTYHHHHH